MPKPRLLLNLSENWTLIDPRNVRGQVALAVEAERAGFDGIMFSEHVVMGNGADARGVPMNPREFAMPGNQHPSYPWPNSLVLMSAVAAATTRVRIIGAAVIAPLRHPLVLAKELATLDLLAEGRLTILPSVSWHRAEYDALDVPFERRGEILDEQLQIWRAAWSGSPASFHGKHFDFDDIWLEPKAFRPNGPTLWFGGGSLHPRMLDRLVRYGSGYMGLGPTSDADRTRMAAALRDAGRDISEIEFVGGIIGRFRDATSCANVDAALGSLASQIRAGLGTFVIKPCQFIDDVARFPEFAAEVVQKANRIAQQIV
jgi:probable F420-dependent oxidoreductase